VHIPCKIQTEILVEMLKTGITYDSFQKIGIYSLDPNGCACKTANSRRLQRGVLEKGGQNFAEKV
jgi:hypothetical protein